MSGFPRPRSTSGSPSSAEAAADAGEQPGEVLLRKAGRSGRRGRIRDLTSGSVETSTTARAWSTSATRRGEACPSGRRGAQDRRRRVARQGRAFVRAEPYLRPKRGGPCGCRRRRDDQVESTSSSSAERRRRTGRPAVVPLDIARSPQPEDVVPQHAETLISAATLPAARSACRGERGDLGARSSAAAARRRRRGRRGSPANASSRAGQDPQRLLSLGVQSKGNKSVAHGSTVSQLSDEAMSGTPSAARAGCLHDLRVDDEALVLRSAELAKAGDWGPEALAVNRAPSTSYPEAAGASDRLAVASRRPATCSPPARRTRYFWSDGRRAPRRARPGGAWRSCGNGRARSPAASPYEALARGRKAAREANLEGAMVGHLRAEETATRPTERAQAFMGQASVLRTERRFADALRRPSVPSPRSLPVRTTCRRTRA